MSITLPPSNKKISSRNLPVTKRNIRTGSLVHVRSPPTIGEECHRPDDIITVSPTSSSGVTLAESQVQVQFTQAQFSGGAATSCDALQCSGPPSITGEVPPSPMAIVDLKCEKGAADTSTPAPYNKRHTHTYLTRYSASGHYADCT